MYRLRRLDNAAAAVWAWSARTPLSRPFGGRFRGRAIPRHILLTALAVAPLLASDIGSGAPEAAANCAIGLIYLPAAFVWRNRVAYRLINGVLALLTTISVAFLVIFGVGLLLLPLVIGLWLAVVRVPTRW